MPTASTDRQGDSAMLTAARDSCAYGISADLTYVSATNEHLLGPEADLQRHLAVDGRAWCDHGVRAVMQSAEGAKLDLPFS